MSEYVTVMKYSLCLPRVRVKFRIRIAWILQQRTIDPGCIISWMTHHRRVLLNIDHSLDWAPQSTVPNLFFCPFRKDWKWRYASYTLLLLPYSSSFLAVTIYKEEIFLNMCLFHSVSLPCTVSLSSLNLCVWLWTHLYWHKDRISVLCFFFSLFLFLFIPQIITLQLSLISSALIGMLPRVAFYVAAFDTCSK